MAGNEHVISMKEFHSRYSVRRVTGETSSSATDEAETKSIQIQTTTLEAGVQKIWEAKENANNQSHLIPKIQKVIFSLRDEKDLQKYYEPRVVSVGPIHHRNPKYQLGEQYKLLLTYEFVKGSKQKINCLYEKIKEKIKDLRDCFQREVTVDYDDEELAWLLLVDGCTILQYIYRTANDKFEELKIKTDSVAFGTSHPIAANDKFEELNIKTDSVAFGQQDLFLLENQLPYRLLKWLMSWSGNEDELKNSIERYIQGQLIVPEDQHSMCCLNWISSIPWKSSKQQQQAKQAKRKKEESHDSNEKPQEPKLISVDSDTEHIHLLDYLRKRLLDIHGPHQVHKIKQGKQTALFWQSYHHFQELRAAGINVVRSKKKNCCLIDVSFTRVACLGYLFLPPIIVDDSTRPKFLNLIAYEMCPDFKNDFGVTSYVYFLGSLIHEANDVKMLRETGVLYNCLGSDEEVAKLFKEISTDWVPKDEIHDYVRAQIEEHYKNKWMIWISQKIFTYFRSPTIMAFTGAFTGLVLTATQTWYAVNSPCDDLYKSLVLNLTGKG